MGQEDIAFIIIKKKSSLSNNCHTVVEIEEENGIKQAGGGMHDPCKGKSSSSFKNMTISMKEITKKGHKVRKRVEHKWPSKPVLAEWVESLLKELDNASRGPGLENNFELHMEVMEIENGDAVIDSMSGRRVGEEPSNQMVIAEHGGVDVPVVGGLLARQ